MPSVQLKVMGCGEAFDGTGLGNTAILATVKGRESLLVDCGYQIPERLWREELHQRIRVIAFTHLHADHALGIVPLLTRYWEENRSVPLDLVGPRGLQAWVDSALQLGYPGMGKRLPFEIRYREVSEKTAAEVRLGGRKVQIRGARTTHSVLNQTLRFDFGKKAAFSVSGDGQITAQSKTLVAGTDIHFQECYTLKFLTPSHADLATLQAAWGEGDPRTAPHKIVLTHAARSERQGLVRQMRAIRRRDPRWWVAVPAENFWLL